MHCPAWLRIPILLVLLPPAGGFLLWGSACASNPAVPERVTVVGFAAYQRMPSDALQVRLADQQAREAALHAFGGMRYRYDEAGGRFVWEPVGMSGELAVPPVAARDIVEFENGNRVFMTTLSLVPEDYLPAEVVADWARAEYLPVAVTLTREDVSDAATGLTAEVLTSVYERALRLALSNFYGASPGPVAGRAWIVACEPRLTSGGPVTTGEYRYRTGIVFEPVAPAGIVFDVDVRLQPEGTLSLR